MTKEDMIRRSILRAAALRSLTAVVALMLAASPIFCVYSYSSPTTEESQAVQDEKIKELGEHITQDESRFASNDAEMSDLRKMIQQQREDLALMRGIVVGVGSLLGLLQAAQAFGGILQLRRRKDE